MLFSIFQSARPSRVWLFVLSLSLILPAAWSATVHGTVSDPSGARINGVIVSLVANGKVVGSAKTASDGSFQISTGEEGRYFLITQATGFRQLETPTFYAGRVEAVERSLVLEPEWVRQSLVVTATGSPITQSQTAASIDVLGEIELMQSTDLVNALRGMPGVAVSQSGQMGAQSSVFVRGGNSDANLVLIDGISAGDLGGRFDVGPLSTMAVERVEVNRGPNSNLYGAGANSSVIRLVTPHGTTNFPSILAQGDLGNFRTTRQEATLAGAHRKLDYLGGFRWLQTSNALPNDEYHVAHTAANLGWQATPTTLLRGTLHYGVDGVGLPGAWNFFQVAANQTEKDQDLLLSGTLDNQTTAAFHNTLQYGASRRREQEHTWGPVGTLDTTFNYYCYGPAYFGKQVTIRGANGYAVTGQAITGCSSKASKYELVSNRDQANYQGTYQITPHLAAMLGYRYEDERGSEPGSTYYAPVERRNSDYQALVHGDYLNRFYYTLGGSLIHYSLFGTQTTSHADLSYAILPSGKGVFSGTRVLLNFGDAVREPALTDEDDSLYSFLQNNGGQSTIQQLNIRKLSAPTTRTYEAGAEQSFFHERVKLRATYFHNEFGRQIEYVGLDLVPELLPNLTVAQQTALEQVLQDNYAYELTLNSEAFRAQGFETTLEYGLGSSLFFHGGYTYTDAVVQRSFTNDDAALLGPIPTFIDGTPIGADSPLKGARPFRRPPHTGFLAATYAKGKWTGRATGSFVSRSDDSDFLSGADANDDNSLLLPNRNLDHGWARFDAGGSYRWFTWLSVYAQAENLLSNQHMAPIGYVSLPFTARGGLKLAWGKSQK